MADGNVISIRNDGENAEKYDSAISLSIRRLLPSIFKSEFLVVHRKTTGICGRPLGYEAKHDDSIQGDRNPGMARHKITDRWPLMHAQHVAAPESKDSNNNNKLDYMTRRRRPQSAEGKDGFPGRCQIVHRDDVRRVPA